MSAPYTSDRRTPYMEVNGVHIGLVQYTATNNTTGKQPILVLIHGFTGSAQSWVPMIEQATSWGWRVIALDMLGHGHSSVPDDPRRYSIEHCQADIVATLQALGIESGEAVLLGYSMGGRIALYTALSGYFRAAILESATPGLHTPQEREQRQRSDEALAKCIEQYGIEAFVDYWERRPIFETQIGMPLKVRQALRQQRLRNNTSGLANSLRGVGTGAQPDLRSRLVELNLPVLLITGAEDQKFAALAQEMLTSLPRGLHVVIPGAGHTAHFEQPERFTAIVREFLQTLP